MLNSEQTDEKDYFFFFIPKEKSAFQNTLKVN